MWFVLMSNLIFIFVCRSNRILSNCSSLQAHVEVLDRDACASLRGLGTRITANMFCAGVDAGGGGGVDACQGDSGGPLVALEGRRPHYAVKGVVSFGFQCGLPGFPGVYADVYSKLVQIFSWLLLFVHILNSVFIYIENLDWILDRTANLSGGYCPRS